MKIASTEKVLIDILFMPLPGILYRFSFLFSLLFLIFLNRFRPPRTFHKFYTPMPSITQGSHFHTCDSSDSDSSYSSDSSTEDDSDCDDNNDNDGDNIFI